MSEVRFFFFFKKNVFSGFLHSHKTEIYVTILFLLSLFLEIYKSSFGIGTVVYLKRRKRGGTSEWSSNNETVLHSSCTDGK